MERSLTFLSMRGRSCILKQNTVVYLCRKIVSHRIRLGFLILISLPLERSGAALEPDHISILGCGGRKDGKRVYGYPFRDVMQTS